MRWVPFLAVILLWLFGALMLLLAVGNLVAVLALTLVRIWLAVVTAG